MKNTLPLGVVTTLDTTGLLVSKSLAIVDGVTGANGLSVGSAAFSFLFKVAKSALEIEMVREFGLITAYLERSARVK